MFGIVFPHGDPGWLLSAVAQFLKKKIMNSAAEFSLWPGASHICGIFLNEVGNCMDIENADYTYSV